MVKRDNSHVLPWKNVILGFGAIMLQYDRYEEYKNRVS